MDRTMNHDEISELLGAFALDAVDPDEAAEINAHLAECPRCAVGGGRALGGDRSHRQRRGGRAGRALGPHRGTDRHRGDRPSPRPAASGVVVVRVASAAPRRCADGWRGRRWEASPLLRPWWPSSWVSRSDVSTSASGSWPTPAGTTAVQQAVQAALLAPGAQKVTLAATSTSPVTEGPRRGTGRDPPSWWSFPTVRPTCSTPGCPALASDRTYQLWGVVQGKTVSLGLLGNHPGDVAFTVNPSAPIKAFAVTDEVAGGVVRSMNAPVAQST